MRKEVWEKNKTEAAETFCLFGFFGSIYKTVADIRIHLIVNAQTYVEINSIQLEQKIYSADNQYPLYMQIYTYLTGTNRQNALHTKTERV